MKLLFILLFLFNSVLSYETEEDKNYFQLYPSESKDKPYLFHFFSLDSKFYTVNSTEGENMTIIKSSIKENESPIKNLSSIITYNNRLLIKTCFGPNKIVEITDENNKIYSPQDNYFKELKNLDKIKYCYSTAIVNPYLVTEHSIVTYWTEITVENGKEIYNHKSILFYSWKKTFSKIYDLNTKDNNFYAQSCTNLRNKYIYCNIDSSFPLSEIHHFSIIPSYIDTNDIDVYMRLVTVIARFSNSIYHKPIGINKYIYSQNGKFAEYFLTEYHDQKNNKTRLMTSLYVNYNLYSFILRFDHMGIYHGINIEDVYIPPSLFNHLLPNNKELIIIYIMKGAGGKNILLLNKYDYDHDLQTKTEFHKYSISNYERDDICQKPKYMQSIFINSFINYNNNEKQIIQKNKNKQYYIYQRDIATLISCDDEKGDVFYQAKKIQMPQCLNTLNEINGIENTLYFSDNETNYKIVLNIENDPNYKSFKNVEIEFFESNVYNRYIIVQGVKNGDRLIPINKTTTLKEIERLEFARTFNFKRGKKYQIPYRIIQTESNSISTKCHLTTDLCFFEFGFKEKPKTESTNIIIKATGTEVLEATEGEETEGTTGIILECPYCLEKDENQICIKCEDIIGIKNKTNGCGCQCDEENGFELNPNQTMNMCICKEGYSFYQDITKCMNNSILRNGDYCIVDRDEKSSIYIYDDIKEGMYVYNKDGENYCPRDYKPLIRQKWFNLGNKYIFENITIDDCVYILYNNSLVMYSNRSECYYKDNYDYNILDTSIKNENDYYSLLDKAYEYNPDDINNSLVIKDGDIIFFIQNNYTKELNSSIELSSLCMDKIYEKYNINSLLIMVANIKKPEEISTQVEYLFYHPSPKFIYKNINISSHCQNNQGVSETINTERRALSLTEEQNKNNLKINQVNVKVQIDWGNKELNDINELSKKEIDILDSANDFYNDICFNYTTPEKTDIYLDDRKKRYNISKSLCETGYTLVKNVNYSKRVECIGEIKKDTNSWEEVSFYEEEKDEIFNKSNPFPNIKVMKCFFKVQKMFTPGQIIALFLLLSFVIISILCPNCCWKVEVDDGKNKENKRKIHRWEEPLEDLKKILSAFEDKPSEEDIDKKDPEIYNELREYSPLDLISEKGNKRKKEKPKEKNDKKRNLKNTSNIKDNKENLENNHTTKTNLITEEEKENKINEIKEEETINTNTNNENDDVLNINNINKEKEEKKQDLIDDKESVHTESSGTTHPDKNQFSYSRDNSSFDISEKEKEISQNIKEKKTEDHISNPPGKGKKSKATGEIPQTSGRGLKKKKEIDDILNEGKETFYKKYLFSINRDISRYQNKASKEKIKYTISQIFFAKVISESNLLFFFPLCCKQTDQNGYFIRYSILILYIACYMSFEILIDFRGSDLHLIVKKVPDVSPKNWLLKIFPPFFVYLLIQHFRKAISLREFYLEELERIKYNIKQYKDIQLTIKMHEERTRIKKFKNNLDYNIKIVTTVGLIILVFNYILVSSFCGIYTNSFSCLVVNALISSIGFSYLISLLLSFIEAIIKRNFKQKLFVLYVPCCIGCYGLLNLLLRNKEEYNEIKDDDEEKTKNLIVKNQKIE